MILLPTAALWTWTTVEFPVAVTDAPTKSISVTVVPTEEPSSLIVIPEIPELLALFATHLLVTVLNLSVALFAGDFTVP